MNDRSIINAPEPDPRAGWIDAYMPDGQMALYQPRPHFFNMATIRGIIFRQRWLIGGVIAAALIVGMAITLLATPMYSATAKVNVEPYGVYILEGQDVDQGVSPNQIYDYLATQVEVIKSRNLAQLVATDLNLADRADVLGKDIEDRRPANISDEEWRDRKLKMATGFLASSVSSQVPDDNWVIPISFRSENPVLAAEMANAYAEVFVSLGTRNSVEDNKYALSYLKEQIDLTRTRLSEAEGSANVYARNSGIIAQPDTGSEGGSGNATLTTANLVNINQRVTDARAARIDAEQRWRSIQNLPASQLPEVQSSPVLSGMVSERTSKLAQLAELSQRYNEDFPQIQNLKAQIGILDEQINRASADIKAAVRNEYTVARNRELALEGELGLLTSDTLVEQDQQVQLSALDREAQALRDQLKVLLDRYNQVSSAANVNRGAVTMLDEASVPGAPYAPDMFQNMLLALVFGVALAGALAVLRETLDDRIRSLEDIEERIGMPLLGHTPHIAERDIEAEGTNRFSTLMESYSSIRAAIDFTLPRSRNIIQLTSSQASEGKSTTAVILAELFASFGRKTLLIDGDLRCPSVARLLDIERPKIGLVEVVLGHAELENAIVKGVHENLEILPVGEIPPNPAEVLASREMREFLEQQRSTYSIIIIDSSPVLGLADAPMLSNLVDGTIFVLEANKVPFGQARSAVRRLKFAGANMLGVVLTKYRALEAGETYSYQYEYYRYDSNRVGR
jgi:capsular exopolysaccharide synthesis family protein